MREPTFEPAFSLRLLAPRHWPMWCATLWLLLFAFMPVEPRDTLARFIALRLMKLKALKKRKNIALTNLSLCFPELSDEQKQQLLENNIIAFCQLMLGYGDLSVRSSSYLQKRVNIIGKEHLFPLLESKEPLILLVPHTYPVDYAGILLASMGHPITTMFKATGNELIDWLMSKQRLRYGGKVFERKAGIKPLLKATKEGYNCFYLPDEDHGPKKSIFTHFFATQKATLPVLGKLAKLSKAKVIPMYIGYNSKTHQLDLHVLKAMENYPSGDDLQDTTQMNQAVEQLIQCAPEQYMWTLKLLKTRPEGEDKIY